MKIHDVEQRSEAWYALRLGLPTASEFSRVVTSKGEISKSLPGYAIQLAAELYAGKPVDAWEGNQWTERGRDLEEEAVARYEFQVDAETTPVGFVTDDAGTCGCSPDRLVGNDGLLEIKCLKAERHVQAILYHERFGHCQPDYVQQTQGQLMVCRRKWCDLVFYHPELPMLTIRRESDPTLEYALQRAIPDLILERDAVLATLRRRAA